MLDQNYPNLTLTKQRSPMMFIKIRFQTYPPGFIFEDKVIWPSLTQLLVLLARSQTSSFKKGKSLFCQIYLQEIRLF